MIFEKFDTDKTGTLDIREINHLFKENQMSIDKEEIKEIFKVVDSDNSNSLTIEEFKKFILSEESKHKFRMIMREVRQKTLIENINRKNNNDMEENCSYIPLTFEAMLNYIHSRSQRGIIRNKLL